MNDQPTINPYMDDTDPYDYDYQPFENKQRQSTTTQQLQQTNQNKSSTVQTKREEEVLKQKALELAKREAELERREKEIKEKSGNIQQVKKSNWPICYPLVYHSIKNEIPPGFKRLIAIQGYIAWFILMACLVINHIASYFVVFLSTFDAYILNSVQFILFSGLFVLIASPAHFVLCYWPLYTTMRTCHIARFLIFFVGYGIAIAFGIFCIVGYYPVGACGIVVAVFSIIEGFRTKFYYAFFISVGTSAMWILYTLFLISIFVQTCIIFRREKHSLKKAKDLVENSAVTNVVKGVVKTMANTSKE